MNTAWVESPFLLATGLITLAMLVAALIISPRRGGTRRKYRNYRVYRVWTTSAVAICVVLLAFRFVVLGAS